MYARVNSCSGRQAAKSPAHVADRSRLPTVSCIYDKGKRTRSATYRAWCVFLEENGRALTSAQVASPGLMHAVCCPCIGGAYDTIAGVSCPAKHEGSIDRLGTGRRARVTWSATGQADVTAGVRAVGPA